MKRSAIVVAFAAVLAMLVAATAAFAGESKGNTLYRYVGELTGKDATSVTVKVQNGNRPALRSLLNKSQEQKFTIGADTVILKWVGGKPEKINWDNPGLENGDYVTVNVRADRNAALEDILKKSAGIVSDHGKNPAKPDKPLYLFRGTLVSADAVSGKVTIDVKGGNHRALRLMLGQASSTQTFLTNGDTVFLHWAHRIPDVIDASKLKVGDRIVIRIRAAGGLDLAAVEATPAKRVADREPRAQESSQSAQA
jgi:hypothetical protein